MSLICGTAVETWLRIPSKRTGEDRTIIIISNTTTTTNNNNNMVTTNKCLSSNLKGETEGLLVAAQEQAINSKHQKLPESNMWPASGEQMQNVFTT